MWTADWLDKVFPTTHLAQIGVLQVTWPLISYSSAIKILSSSITGRYYLWLTGGPIADVQSAYSTALDNRVEIYLTHKRD